MAALIGASLMGWWFAKKRGLGFYPLADLCVVAVPIGLGLGRIGNFINGELFGRPTKVPWAVVFPQAAWCRVIPRSSTRLSSKVWCCFAYCSG